MSIPIAFGTTALSDRLIPFFYSSAYANAIPALQILIWAVVFMFFNALLSFVLYSAEKQKVLVFTTGVMLALNVVLNLWLIPKYSYIAASFTTVLTEVVGFSANFVIVSRAIVRIRVAEPIIKAVVSSLLMMGVIYLLKEANLALLVLTGAFTYVAVLIITGAIDYEDRKLLLSAFFNRRKIAA